MSYLEHSSSSSGFYFPQSLDLDPVFHHSFYLIFRHPFDSSLVYPAKPYISLQNPYFSSLLLYNPHNATQASMLDAGLFAFGQDGCRFLCLAVKGLRLTASDASDRSTSCPVSLPQTKNVFEHFSEFLLH